MSFWEAVFLGALQGLTEFLPVSSSGHLFLASTLFNIQANIGYFVYLHAGTLIAVVVVYFDVIRSMFKNPKDYRFRFLLISAIPTFLIAALYKFLMPSGVESYLLPFGFALTAFLLIFARKPGRATFIKPKTKVSLLVGVAQGIAVLPGLSRSGSTVSMMSFLGLNKKQAAELSFLMSIPVILGGAVVETLGVLTTPQAQPSTPVLYIICGVAVAALLGIVAIHFFKRLLLSDKLHYFALYLAIPFLLSVLCLI